ncbi:MAG: arginine decarboxylase, partial [Planctomycetota bacterium]
MAVTRENAWSKDDAADLYGLNRWSAGFFSIDDHGRLLVHPDRDPQQSICVPTCIDELIDRGLRPPILLRFNGILRRRLRDLDACFKEAIAKHQYESHYRCIYPIKVNQHRDVVREIVTESVRLGFGIEAGSKPELVAAIAMSSSNVPIVLNGFKDSSTIGLAMHAHRMGRT